ncbi:unnamed protein product [Clonostachys rhizophaga]|uniref:Flavin reductase like domain-containing protein n=1 Tax=Clonostachys rhizophaga TaxID=160324 RepID=A0A9N9YQJ6_9HYPO|nr:unnamed protein product [Clonostachys rhizophaga]
MFYTTEENNHGLAYDPFKACVVPRPIGWISTVSADGKHNLAPFSQFTNVTYDPPMVIFSANNSLGGGRKDTVSNIQATKVFCWQIATYALREEVNKTAEMLAPEVDEFERAGLQKTWSQSLKTPVPMVAASPVRFECEYVQTIQIPGNPPFGTVDLVIGRVVGVHIDESVLTDGKVDVAKTNPISRLGYYEYGVIGETFEMVIPGDKTILAGLEGSPVKSREAVSDKPSEKKERDTAEDIGS